MAEATITIPSPSVFLRTSPEPAAPETAKRKSTIAKHAKKKAPRKSIGSEGGCLDATLAKPKQSKSRNGCVTCKAKRLKCDEAKPKCQQCIRRKVECGGYKKDFKWRPFEETNVKINIDRQRRRSPPKHASTEHSKATTPTSEDRVSLGDASTEQVTPRSRNNCSEYTPDVTDVSLRTRPLIQNARRPSEQIETSSISSSDELFGPALPTLEEISMSAECPAEDAVSPVNVSESSMNSIMNAGGLSPTLTELFMPCAHRTSSGDSSFVNFTIPDDYQMPVHPQVMDDMAPLFNSMSPNSRRDIFRYGWMAQNSPNQDHSGLAATSPLSPVSMDLLHQRQSPGIPPHIPMNERSPELLPLRFHHYTCGILSVMNGPNENPWRTLIWPLAQMSPALYHAVIAMTAYHSSKDIPEFRVVGHEHKQASIRNIQEGIRDHSMTDHTAIATALALALSESWDQHTASGNTHIKGAQALVKRALAEHQRKPLRDVELARLKFLCNAWVYMDVIVRLTAVDCDESEDFDNTFVFAPDAPQMVMGDPGSPGFGIDFGMPIDARLDPLMGCANTLFPLIGRVANLVRKVCRSERNSPAVISQANDLKVALESWEPPDFIETPEDPTTDVQHTLQTADAYRWATLLHLHQSVPELPSASSAELAQRTLSYLATVPTGSRTIIVHIYPLMVAGCEATSAEDRHWVRDRWDHMDKRMRIGVIEKCLMVTEQVWRRKDTYEAQPTGRRKLVATADLQNARQRGHPIHRREPGADMIDSGRTGMVFSYVDAEGDAKTSGALESKRTREARHDRIKGMMDPAYTVRGHLHWIGVMWDWGWEVLLG